MSELYDKSIRTLELPAVLDVLAQKAVSEAARERCRKLYPSSDLDEVRRLLDEHGGGAAGSGPTAPSEGGAS